MYCGNCGAEAGEGQQYCIRCGANLREQPSTNDEAPAIHADRRRRFETRPTEIEISVYAGFWKRMAARILDNLVVLVAVVVVLVPLMALDTTGFSSSVLIIPYLLVPWLYSALMESSSRQATLGKMALGIKVTDREGNRLKFAHATGRFFSQLISTITFGVGFVMAAFTQRRQALHDMVASTLVVKKEYSEEEVATALPAPNVSLITAIGLTLLVVLGGPFGIGVLAAIAIPAYQEYSIRLQVSDGLINAAPYKAAIANAIENGKAVSQIDSTSLNLEQHQRSNVLDAIEVQGGVVVLTFGGSANQAIAGKTIELTPGINEQQQLVWRCGYAHGPADTRFPGGHPGQYTTIMPRYLPSMCRATTL